MNANGNVIFTSGSNADPSILTEVQARSSIDPFQARSGLDLLPAFNAYSPSGIAEAGALVYVNFGRVEDFQKLRDLGVAVAERILVARSGKIHPVSLSSTN